MGLAKKTGKTNTNKRSAGAAKTASSRSAKKGGATLAGEITVLLVLAFCLLLFLANFKLVGSVGEVMRSVMLGLFGSLGYLFPAALFLLFCFLLSNRGSYKAVFRSVLGVLFFLLLCGFLHLISGEFDNFADFSDYYHKALTSGLHGGAVGGFFGILLIPTFGTVGSYVITLILLAVLFVGFTGISLLTPIKRHSASLASSARESASRHKESAARRREERREDARIRRAEQQEDAEKMRQVRREETYRLRQERRERRARDMEEELASLGGSSAPRGVTFVDLELPERAAEDSSSEVPFVMDEPAPATVSDPLPEPEPEPEPEMPAEPAEPVKPVRRAAAKPKEKTAEPAEALEIPAEAPAPAYQFPPLSLLTAGKVSGNRSYGGEQKTTAAKLEQTMNDFGVSVHVADITRGPSVTRYELTLDHGVKVSRVLALTDDKIGRAHV